MKKGNLKEVCGELLQIADKNSPAILTGCVCAAAIGAAVIAWFNAPKAKKVVDDYKEDVKELAKDLEENYPDEIDEETAKEFKNAKNELTTKMVFGVAKNVLPVILMVVIAIVCAISANTVSSKRIAALTAAYSISEKALSDYTAKAAEMLTDKKVNQIESEIAKDKVDENPPTVDDKKLIIPDSGDVLCYDTVSGRYFKSNPTFIRDKVNDLNAQLMNEYYVSLNEFYNMIGLAPVEIGYMLGFCIDSGKVEMHFGYQGDDKDYPVLVLNYHVSPKYTRDQRLG